MLQWWRMAAPLSPGDVIDGNYVIEGKGFGHGVGLCAFGANGMAKSGATCEEILKHYYSGAEIKTH